MVAIALKRESSFAQIAKDFGISESCEQRWVKIAEVDGGRRPGVSSSEAAENSDRLLAVVIPHFGARFRGAGGVTSLVAHTLCLGRIVTQGSREND